MRRVPSRSSRLFPGWVLTLALGLGACGGGGSATDAPAEVPFSTLVSELHSGLAHSETHWITTPQAWGALWQRHTLGRSPAPALPSVDFDQTQVLAVFLSPQPDGCRRVSITRILQSTQGRTVYFERHTPGPTELCAAVVITPAHIVSVAASPLPVRFVQQ